MVDMGIDLNDAIDPAAKQTQEQITGLGEKVDTRINELMKQGDLNWDSSAFLKQSAIQAGGAMDQGYVNVLTNQSQGLINGPIGGVEELEPLLQQQYAQTV
jgi:hypothetical protein